MRTEHQLDALSGERQPVVLAIGFFDGVHRGHLAILKRTVERARELGGQAWALTFDPHPAKVLAPESAPALLTSTAHKIELLKSTGLDGVVVQAFTREFSLLSPSEFLDLLQATMPSLRSIVVGANWTFGRGRSGSAAELTKQSGLRRIEAIVVEPVLYKQKPISSTRIREAVSDGRFEDAREMLGRPFSILGTVIRGRQVGRQLGFPTVNLDPHNEVRPPAGVYAVWVRWREQRLPGAAFLADVPFAQQGPSGFLLEVHIMGFDREIYGEDVEVFFVEWLREPRSYPSIEELRMQISRDVEDARRILASNAAC